MATFIIGLVILFGGAALYGTLCEKVFGPDDRATPAYAKQDGVDYVPMRCWKNSLINLLNIAGTGPIFGPIQGILFGPIAFITIPIGNIIGGAMHDYFCGMICLRDGGSQMSNMIRKYSNKGIYTVYNIFVCVLLLLVGAVFIYTPGDIAATGIFGFDGLPTSVSTWVIYGVIFAYYLVATVFPIDAIIGRIYPIFGAILMFSALGIFIGLFAKGYPLMNIWDDWNGAIFAYGDYFGENHFIPIFFVTVACGILSGFHSTQTAIISRTVKSERQGRMTFYNMMVLEGFIAMVWAAAAMGIFNLGIQEATAGTTSTVIAVCKDILGPVGGIIALLGVIILPVTSGDTALRALRLTLSESLHLDQSTNAKRLSLTAPVFVLVGFCLLPAGAAFLLPLGALARYWVLLVLFCGCQLGCSVFSICAATLIQSRTPAALMGKVMSCVFTLSMCAQPLGQLVYGFLFDRLAPPWVLLPSGLLLCAVGALSAGFFRRMDQDAIGS